MSFQRKDINIPHNTNNKINNINLISVEKSPNKILSDINNQENNNPNDSNMQPFDDLIKTKNEDGSNFSNINIDREQEYNKNADILFGDSDNEKENSKQNVYSNHLETSNDYTINEEKRIEAANNLFDRSMSMNSNINNNDVSSYTMNTINYEKRKEAADILFQSQSDITSKDDNNEILNESIQTNRTNMTKIINNLTGSNMGLNINELANKCAERDKMIHESIHSNDSDFIKNTQRENTELGEEDEGIQFNKNLIEFKDKINNGNLNDLNNLGNIQTRNKKPKISLKNALIKSNKKHNGIKSIINISDNNINNMDDNNEEKKEEEKKIKNNIIDESIIRDSKESNKKEIIELDKNEKQKSTKGVNLKELFSKNKKATKKNEKVKLYLEENFSEEQRSNEILMKKKEKGKKENKTQNDNNNETISIKEEKEITRKSELIKETEKFPSVINKEIKDTNNDSNHLITENNNLLKGRNIFSKENDENKFIQIQIKKKENKNIIEEENKINEIQASISKMVHWTNQKSNIGICT